MITDVAGALTAEVIDKLESMPETVRLRVLALTLIARQDARAGPADECWQPRRAAGIGFKIVKGPPANLGQFIRCVHVRLITRWRWGCERHRDLPLTAVGDEELRLQICQRHPRKIKTNFLSDFASRGRFQHIAPRDR